MAVACACALAQPAGAATLTVDRGDDAGAATACTVAVNDCSLRGAITNANLASSGTDQIDVDASVASMQLDSPLPPVIEQLSIDGSGKPIIGSATYASACTPADYAIAAGGAILTLTHLPIYSVCDRAVLSPVTAPTIQVGPRRADGTVAISGSAAPGTVELYRADAPAAQREALATYADSIASSGVYSHVPVVEPVAGERYTAAVTGTDGSTSNFAVAATTPSDLTSPTFQRAVAISNNTVRLDFDESISPSINAQPAAFSLSVGGFAREVTNVGANGSSIYLTTLTTPWGTGDAGSISFTGVGRVTDVVGNELIGTPNARVFAGPGEVTGPVVSNVRVDPGSFCQVKTKRCSKRAQAYVRFTLSKPARLIFTVSRAKGRRFVVEYVHRYDKGQVRSRLRGTMNGRRLPATGLIVRVVAEDVARNLSPAVEAPFKVVTRNSKLGSKAQKRLRHRSRGKTS